MLQFLKKMPKVELHAHLGGSCPKDKLLQLLDKYGHHKEIDNITNPKYEFGDWFQSLFYPPSLLMKTKKGLREYVNAVLQGFAEDNVVYLELRTTPRSGEDFNVTGFFDTIIEESQKYKDSMKVKLIFSLNRDIKQYEIYSSILQDIQKVNDWKNYIVGIDFSGNPKSRTFAEFIPILKKSRQIGLGMSIHTAQVVGQIPQTKQILDLIPERIGHFSYYNADQLQQVIDQGTVIQICISSNIITKGLKTILDHHITEFHDKKVKHCVCTDDVLLFQKSLSQQYQNYATILNLSEKQCFAQSKQTINYIFAKQQREFIEAKFSQFINKQSQNYKFLKEFI